MKTRSNMPLYVVETNNVKALSNSQIDLLRCGDYLVKKDESGEHAYKVTFKSDTGMCITYHDASVIETQSYDKVDGNWVYNSEDKTENLLENVKPIYFHPITILGGGDYDGRLMFVILDNNSTAYTITTFKAKCKELMDNGAILQCNGYIKDSINSKVLYTYLAYKSGGDYYVEGNDASGSPVDIDFDSAVVLLLQDGVNKIN